MTAKQLATGFLDAPPLFWDRSFVENLREIRGFPNWWRIRDDESYIDGPPQEGAQYTREQFNWKGEIRKDAVGDNLDTIDLFNLAEFWEYWDEELADGSVNMYFKYTPQPPKHTHVHTALVDSVSIEFDQLGRRVIAFESEGDVYLLWYDSQAADFVVTNFGAGYNPQVVTDTYRRTGSSDASTRYLFYVDGVTKQIVYRAQLDRFGVVYTLPTAPSDVVELLRVSKNLYGGLTALYVYEDSGELKTGSFTARSDTDQVNIGTDKHPEDTSVFMASEGRINAFLLKTGGVDIFSSSVATLAPSSGTISDFQLRSTDIQRQEQVSSTALVQSSGSIVDFILKSALTNFSAEDTTVYSATTGSIIDFQIKVALIPVESYGADIVELSQTTGTVLSFTLG